tara:strand:- start:10 stop:1101 length:1092 start_codon:yes stop_codon:yes gene_type:complete
MNKKIKALIAVGGTGGHVFPGLNLASALIKKNYSVKIITDKRGYKFFKEIDKNKTLVFPSSPLVKKNIVLLIFSFLLILYSIFRSLLFLSCNRPNIIFGMGGYASFPICIAAAILRIKFVIYENNLIIGRANKKLLPFADRILVSNKQLEGISSKYDFKTVEVGNIIKEEIINFSLDLSIKKKELKILVLGGSQAAQTFAEVLPKIFQKCADLGILIKIIQHCLPHQNQELSSFYEKYNIEHELFNFSDNLIKFFSKVNLAITRSGSSMLAELTNANIPFISIPLPSSVDDHQLKNATFYKNKNFSFLVEEKDLNDELLNLLKEIYENMSKLDEIKSNQRQYSDKHVYKNINKVLDKILNEKN